jgi:hypothetical protein
MVIDSHHTSQIQNSRSGMTWTRTTTRGWWEGVVTEELTGGRLGVFFSALRELIGFEKEDLRLHRDWVHGKWVPPFEQDEVGI